MEYGSYKSSAIFSLITLVFIGLGDGERFFQYRDHRDQEMFDQEKESLAVHNKLEAEVGEISMPIIASTRVLNNWIY